MAKRHGTEFWQEHLDAWHQSDLTQKAYCANQGLGEKAFYRRHRKEKEAIVAAKATLHGHQDVYLHRMRFRSLKTMSRSMHQ